MSASVFTAPVVGSGCVGLQLKQFKLFPVKESAGWRQRTVSNGSKTYCMKTWNPINNKKFETLSYLPPLSDDSLPSEIDYMLKKGWVPCLEFDEVGYVRAVEKIAGCQGTTTAVLTLWKLPMFGCNDSSQVLHEISE
ncbi:ribulose bisphosphate carboxylase small chain, chloroplastic-like [Eucalyptus grandis]|uniref:ribulose bisphosphate carboxylase small chain, chloroplastic-like n=1 Tax=Eucalyptus grandis TaxID=71139 RepID=UPI00192EF09B|nr:ribulose bisphosphate carboxylase small chain, chloroplastic-like [Eucalyptus grandis]